MKKLYMLMGASIILLLSIIVVCSQSLKNSNKDNEINIYSLNGASEKIKINEITENSTVKNRNNTSDEKTILKPIIPQWSLEQIIGADMAELDYASEDRVIFHGSFGLFIYDLNKLAIICSLDLKPIKCAFTQGDEYCEVQVSKDGNTVQLHPMNSEQMYAYSVSDDILCETSYRPMENSFGSQFVTIEKAIDKPQANFSYNAVEFDSGEYGYLYTDDFTLGTLNYIRGDMVYSLFKSIK